MKYQAVAFAASTLLSLTAAGPSHRHHHVRRVTKREVPQEHSHEVFLGITREFLNKENPKGIADPVFGLLGDAAAKNGAGQVTNLACLHQETADQAFTNAKAAKDIRGMSAALVYATLERNTQGIGQTSAACTDKAVNPEIAALKQHQDPAGETAAADNKAITLELAKQLASVGGDPMLALESGTFAPGDKADSTLKGNSCDDENDKTGCIFSLKTLVLDATPEEITAAVAGITPTITGGTGELKADHIDVSGLAVAGQAGGASGGAASGGAASGGAASGGATNSTGSGNASNASNKSNNNASNKGKSAACAARNNAANNSTGNAGGNNGNNNNNGNSGNNNNNNDNSGNASGTNVQTFTGDLGGLPPPVIQSSGNRPFSVNGDTFVGKGAALGRSCDVQKNKCANAVNSGQLEGSVAQCDEQGNQCRAAIAATKRRRRSVSRKLNEKRQTAATDFGSCSDPSIAFSNSLPDRQSAGFIANNLNDFNHGSAQKIGIVAGFICQRLQDSCKAPAATVESCKTAEAAAQAATQDQAAADAFNTALIGASAAGNVTRRW